MSRRGSLIVVLMFFMCGTVRGQDQPPVKEHDIEQITVHGRRLSDIGITRTVLDSVSLRENITYSLSDVLTQYTPIFIKSYGRGTMSTASFRGTSPSHTQVTWNGMVINSPMFGMVDFSLIPSYFIDDASVLHGAGSVNAAGGGLGGAIVLGTQPAKTNGLGLQYIQGISSYSTYDEFLKFDYGSPKLHFTTRINYTSSDNDFRYTNYDKRPNPDGSLITDRNRNGHYRDFHALQEVYYIPDDRNRLSAAVWFMDSDRGLPLLTVNYRGDDQSRNGKDERTLRFVSSWQRSASNKLSMKTSLGYIYSKLSYRYLRDVGAEQLKEVEYTQSTIYTGYGSYGVQWFPTEKLTIDGGITLNMHWVDSQDRYTRQRNNNSRAETSTKLAVKYKPYKRLGIGAEIREETYASKIAAPIYAGFADYLLWPRYNVVLKASAARNYRFPTQSDLYFKPGGNDSLRAEKGYTYEGGLEFHIKKRSLDLKFEATAYDSHIKDWILWLPNFQGIWSPMNVRKVHSYGLELKGRLAVELHRDWLLSVDANWGLTRSINYGQPVGDDDQSVGKQLMYIPERSNAVRGELSWRSWSFVYKYTYYSQRYTSSSNEPTLVDRLGSYYMNDISLEKRLSFRFANLSLKACVYNLFNEEYVTVLSRPMPKRNYGFFIGITPNFKSKAKGR